MRKNKLRSRIVGQIHDSMLIDVHKDEVDYVIEAAHRIMIKDLMDTWKWIIVPLQIDIVTTPLGGNWFQKQEIKV